MSFPDRGRCKAKNSVGLMWVASPSVSCHSRCRGSDALGVSCLSAKTVG